jgi:hypothetical protein
MPIAELLPGVSVMETPTLPEVQQHIVKAIVGQSRGYL